MKVTRLVVVAIILAISFLPLGTAAGTSAPQCMLSINEGGHLDTDYGTMFMAEWWYLNGSATLEGEHGERRKVRFFAAVAHQESPQLVTPDGGRLSQLLHFFAFYPDNGPPVFKYDETYLPQAILTNYIAIHTPYVSYAYPDGTTKLHGTGESAYHLTQNWGNIGLNVTLHPRVDQTIDQAHAPQFHNLRVCPWRSARQDRARRQVLCNQERRGVLRSHDTSNPNALANGNARMDLG